MIGIYKVIGNIYENPELLELPAPLEVDRHLYVSGTGSTKMVTWRFRPLARCVGCSLWFRCEYLCET
ncbi:hypothetical protein [Streptococcus oralis]|uniref:hypothetical protein n=1 Tax=Streptococcus oralis TaxID=1303 RepID=UPI001156A79C